MNRHNRKSLRFWSLLLILALAGPACSRPTTADRDNRRVLDEILTAITIKNTRLLEESAVRAEGRHADGHFSDDDYRAIAAFIAKARDNDWPGAESDAYAFRKQRPFVRPGP
jgi:hypothetical protein